MKEAISANKNVYEEALKLLEYDSRKILDVGSGNGEFVRKMKEEGCEDIICTDKECTMKYPYKFIHSDLNEDFIFESNKFDVVTSLAIIEHLENPRHFLRECKRVVKPGGYIILSTPSIEHFKARIKFLIKGVLYGFDVKDYEISGHITPITSYDIRRICKELDLEIEDFEYNDSKKTTMIVKIRKPIL